MGPSDPQKLHAVIAQMAAKQVELESALAARDRKIELLLNPPVPGYLSCPLIPYLKSIGGDRSV